MLSPHFIPYFSSGTCAPLEARAKSGGSWGLLRLEPDQALLGA